MKINRYLVTWLSSALIVATMLCGTKQARPEDNVSDK